MHARLIPYTVPEFDKKTPLLILDCILEESISDGKNIIKMEKKFAEYIGTRYAISFASGRAALYYVYTFFYESNKKILLPSYTCIPAVDAARWAGFVPHFLDIDLNSYNPKFTENVKKIKNIGAISLSYLYGLIGNVKPFIDYAKDNNIPLIEDAAIALGASYKGKKAGSIGDAGIFSFQESKIITSWRGGIVTTNNKKLYEYLNNIREIQRYPSSPEIILKLLFSYFRSLLSSSKTYGFTMYPLKRIMTTKKLIFILEKIMNFNPLESINGISPEKIPNTEKLRFSNVQASVILKAMKNIENIIKKRRVIAKCFSEELEEIVHIPKEEKNLKHAYGRFPIRISGKNKTELYNYFLKHGIETSINYPYICPKTKFMLKYKFNIKNYPNAVTASRETILLPFHTHINEKDISIIINAVKKL